jgi:hypothetical protein
MKSVTIAVLCLIAISLGFVQQSQSTPIAFTVVSTVPTNLATNVSASTTTVSITFSDAVDTTFFTAQGKGATGGMLTNFDSLTAVSFSTDHKTVILTVKLSAGKPYFAGIFSAKSATAVPLTSSYAFYFTTAGAFPTTTVSGSVLTGSSSVATGGSFVGLSLNSLSQGDPTFAAGAIADGNGNFTVPYVPNGTLYPLAAKDVNGDGQIDPNTGDAVGTGNQIVVNGTNLTGVTITFTATTPYRFKDALDSINAHSSGFSSPRVLRTIEGSSIDSLGRGGQWEFDYTGPTLQTSFVARLQTFGLQVQPLDSMQWSWVKNADPLTVLPATAVVDSFLARAERSGGYAYRPRPMSWNGFDVHMEMGKLASQNFGDMVSDTSKNYLGVTYWYGVNGQNSTITYGQRRFIGDYTTGAILGTTAIAPDPGSALPGRFALGQNYPNPFNPATNVEFSLPSTTTVQLKVYNLLGQEVATLVNGTLGAGTHTARFDASHLSSGIYLYRLVAGSFVSTMKMVLLK